MIDAPTAFRPEHLQADCAAPKALYLLVRSHDSRAAGVPPGAIMLVRAAWPRPIPVQATAAVNVARAASEFQ
jgi:hypothetical protein